VEELKRHTVVRDSERFREPLWKLLEMKLITPQVGLATYLVL
jgi:hypothetical protein